MTRALIVVDVQNDFCEGGALAVAGGASVARRIARSIIEAAFSSARKTYEFVVATKDWHINPGAHFSENPDYKDSWPNHCDAETDGARFHPGFVPAAFSILSVFKKGQFSAAYSGFEGYNDLDQTIDDLLSNLNVDTVDIVGLAFGHCVKATALDAARLGYKVRVLKEYTASVHPDDDEKDIAELEAAGVEVIR